jgi:uncharacterized cupin superfamily protein
MKAYLHSDLQNDLDELPLLSESPGYEIVEGSPRASIRLDAGSSSSSHRLGIWKCTPGAFKCTEKGDELQTLIRGKLTLIYEDGSEFHFGPSDSIYTEKGERVTWKVTETVEKVFFTHDEDGTK